MFIAYYDESGDDGYPRYSSPLFVLTALYLHHLNWKECYYIIKAFRKKLKEDYGLPVRMEMHAKNFILNKKPYRLLNISDDDRISVFDLFCDFLAQLDIKLINVAILKTRVTSHTYAVLDSALTYSIQRIENDLKRIDPTTRFLIVTDTGRVGKMRRTSRRIQIVNYIPSKFGPEPYRREIELLIEDPLPKDSKESYYIQLSDFVAHVVYLYVLDNYGIGRFHNRMPRAVNSAKIIDWMDRLKSSLNVEASGRDPYGVVCYPR